MLIPLVHAGNRLQQLMSLHDPIESALEAGRVLKRRAGGRGGQLYYLYIPRSAGENPPLMVSIHGKSRNARQHARLLSSMAERFGVIVLAPLFGSKQFPDYQRLDRRAGLAFERIVAEVMHLTGADSRRLYLFGNSCGAQFVQRYAMVHPQRVAGVVIGAVEGYTAPQSEDTFTQGAGLCHDLPGLRFDICRFLRVPMTVIVDDSDTAQESGPYQSDRIDRSQGRTQVERALAWARTMNMVAKSHGLPEHFRVEVLPCNEHSFKIGDAHGGMHYSIFKHLFGCPARPIHGPAAL